MSTHAGFSTALRHPAVAAGGGVPVRAPRPAPHTQRRRRHGPCAPPTSHAWHAPGGRLPMSEGGCGVGGEGKRGGGAQGGSRVAQRDSLVPPGRRGVARGGAVAAEARAGGSSDLGGLPADHADRPSASPPEGPLRLPPGVDVPQAGRVERAVACPTSALADGARGSPPRGAWVGGGGQC